MTTTFFQRNTSTAYPSGPIVKTKAPILLVEDIPIIQFLHQEFLKPMVCDVAVTGIEALTMASQQCYKLILLDLGLPDINGIEVMQRLRVESQNQKTPIVILTAHGGEFLPKHLLSQVEQVIYKPVNRLALFRLALEFAQK
jgi:CheY-like chemotaxis protein